MNPTKEQIKETRKQAGLTQQTAADKLGVTLRTWSYWETGGYKMRPQLWEYFNILIKTKG